MDYKEKTVIEQTTEITDDSASDVRQKVIDKYGEKVLNTHLDATNQDIERVLDRVYALPLDEARQILEEAAVFHADDSNFPAETFDKIQVLLQGVEAYGQDEATWEFDLKAEAALIAYFSPYPEVRSVTDPDDDPSIPVETLRVYLLAIVWTAISTVISQFFTFRKPSITLTAAVVQLFLYPCGMLMHYVLPRWTLRLFGWSIALNPGPWNYKEQMLATIIVNVANGATYVTKYNIPTESLEQYYNTPTSLGYDFLMNFSSQFFGFGFAGILRRFLVYPVKCIWPSVLPTVALNRALLRPERRESINGWTISRYAFFGTVFAGSFLYFWVPQYLFQVLSSFNWMTWIAPKNFNLAVITGSSLGLGLNPVPTFDWNIANYSYALSTPFYSQLQQYLGMFFSMFVVIALYWTNYKWCSYVPVNTNDLRDHFNKSYNVSRILTNGVFDEDKYQAYSPPYYSAGFLVTYGASMIVFPLVFFYTTLMNWRQLRDTFRDAWLSLRHRRSGLAFRNDVHSRLMSAYKEVPDWWFAVVLALALAFGIVCVKVYPTETMTPWWGIVVVCFSLACFLIPVGIVQSVTGYQMGTSVLAEIVGGFMFPGNGIANLILKCYGYETDAQAESFVADLKMAHYAKIPPRAVFRGQMIGTIVQCCVSIVLVRWQLSSIHDLCSATQPDRFTCPSLKTIYSASVMWGVIGPMRTMQGVYPVFAWCFLVGAIMGPTFYVLKRHTSLPRRFKWFRQLDPVLLTSGCLHWSPYNLSYYTANFYLSFAFMYVIRRRYLAWWEKYNYVLSAAMTAGVAFSAVIIFFAVQYNDKAISWWGNSIGDAGIDGGVGQQTRLPLPERGYFGIEIGHYP
ncbi:OPT oligopeptide transporter protein-domain-containing protein [Dipodascopsis tothii]|uniref:OPT oligopeptide transporter protein-domain-containing protein n=1 Tax=Dipodascopsis tothii TaxID=44089 RepID=UPI0034CFFF5E